MSNRKAADKQRMATRKETQERHASMRLIVRECKIHPQSSTKQYYFRRLFAEGRWVYNWFLQQYNDGKKLIQISTTDSFAIVLTPGGYEMRSIVALSSQMVQQVKTQLGTNLSSFFTNLKNGNIKHGSLRYKKECSSIPLKAGKWASDEDDKRSVTYALNDKRTRLKLQGYPHLFKITGGEQIPREAELADGKIVRRAGEYFLQVTFFVERDKSRDQEEAELLACADALVGKSFDVGISRQFVDELNDSVSWRFDETDRLKHAQKANASYRAWHKKQYGWAVSSKRQLSVMARENERLRRKKKAAIDEFVGSLRKVKGFVAIQDEQVSSWHSDARYSEVVHHSVMGGVIARLKREPSTLVVGKWRRTTGVCPDCGHVLEDKLDTSVREWDCPCCGAHHDRDHASARVIGLLACVQLLYPDCPSALSSGVWRGLLGVLGLECPVGCLDRVGLNSGGCGVATGIGQLSPEAQVL